MDEEIKKQITRDAEVELYIQAMEVNRMQELPRNSNFKWAMIEHNDSGYCWTIGYKGICTTIYSMDKSNEIKYWGSEAEAKSDLIKKISSGDLY